MTTYIIILIVWMIILFGGVYALAKRQFIFTFCKEGEIMFVTAGGSGSYHKLIYSIEGWVYDEYSRIFTKETDDKKKNKGLLEKWFGIHIVGIPFYHQIHEWEFTWNKWSKPDKETAFRIVPRTDTVRSLIFQFPYAISIPGVEIQGQIDVDFELLVTLRSINPYNALFLTGSKWLDTVVGNIEATTKEFIGQFDIDRVRRMESGVPDMDIFILRIKSLTGQLTVLAGQEVVDVRLLRYTQQGTAEMKEATQAREKARLLGEGLVEKARKEKEAAVEEATKIGILAEARKKELDQTTIHLAGGPGQGAVEAFKWQQIGGKNSKLTNLTLLEKDSGVGTNISVP